MFILEEFPEYVQRRGGVKQPFGEKMIGQSYNGALLKEHNSGVAPSGALCVRNQY